MTFTSLWGLCHCEMCERMCAGMAHPGFESNELQNHFHSEDSGEDHVKDVHDIIEECRLAVVLKGQREERRQP